MGKPAFGDKIKVSLSSSFISRAKCSKCGGEPEFFYYVKLPFYHKTVHRSNFIIEYMKKTHKRMCHDYYLVEKPKSFNDVSAFKAKNFIKYKPKYHMSKNPEFYNGSMLSDCITCKCRKTVWEFKQSTPNLESQARRAKITFSKKFTY